MPAVPPAWQMIDGKEQPRGWCAGQNRIQIRRLCNAQSTILIDGGTWLGLSAYNILVAAPKATVICIDHWRGSLEHQSAQFADQLSTLYETCLVNLWNFRDRVIPLRADSIEGLKEIARLAIEPNMIYVDWSHDAQSVCCDLLAARHLFPRAILLGDDWTLESVRQGVAMAGLDADTYDTCYVVRP